MKVLSKRLAIYLMEEGKDFSILSDHFDFNQPMLTLADIRNIFDAYYEETEEGDLVSKDDFMHAIDTILVYYMQNNLYKTIVDINERNKGVLPGAKEMTLKEIEEALGHPVIIKEDK